MISLNDRVRRDLDQIRSSVGEHEWRSFAGTQSRDERRRFLEGLRDRAQASEAGSAASDLLVSNQWQDLAPDDFERLEAAPKAVTPAPATRTVSPHHRSLAEVAAQDGKGKRFYVGDHRSTPEQIASLRAMLAGAGHPATQGESLRDHVRRYQEAQHERPVGVDGLAGPETLGRLVQQLGDRPETLSDPAAREFVAAMRAGGQPRQRRPGAAGPLDAEAGPEGAPAGPAPAEGQPALGDHERALVGRDAASALERVRLGRAIPRDVAQRGLRPLAGRLRGDWVAAQLTQWNKADMQSWLSTPGDQEAYERFQVSSRAVGLYEEALIAAQLRGRVQ